MKLLMTLNRKSQNIKEFLLNASGYLFSNQENGLNYNDMHIITSIKKNEIPNAWLEILNLDFTDNLIDWFSNFIKKFSEIKSLESNDKFPMEVSIKNPTIPIINVFDSIFNLMLQFSLKNKVNYLVLN